MLDQIITLTATAFVSLMIVDFTLGLVKLWNASKPVVIDPQNQPFELPKTDFDKDIWLEPFKVSQPHPQPLKPLITPLVQLYLPPAKEKITETVKIDLLSYTIRELKTRAKDRGLKSYSRFTKAELVQALI